MNLETQLTYVNNEIQIHTDAIATLQAIKDSLNGTSQLGSLTAVVTERDALKVSNDDYKSENVLFLSQISDLTATNTEAQAKIDDLTKQVADLTQQVADLQDKLGK